MDTLDFFISYTAVDQAWAEWIAMQLEKAGQTTFIQAWDIKAGMNFLYEMHQASILARRTLLVLSPAYFTSRFGFSEWAAAFLTDPTGEQQRLLPVRVAPGDPPGLLGPIVYVDLVGLPEEQARTRLLFAIQPGRHKPGYVPFPGSVTTPASAPYPGAAPAFSAPSASPEPARQLTSAQAALTGAIRSHSCVLSHAPEDAAFVSRLYHDLTSSGVPCMHVEQDIRIGDHLQAAVSQAILHRDHLLLVLSQHALTSRWVEETIEFALDRERQQPGTWLLFPLRLDDAVMKADTWWAITVRQRMIGDFSQWQDHAAYEKVLQRVLRDLQVEDREEG